MAEVRFFVPFNKYTSGFLWMGWRREDTQLALGALFWCLVAVWVGLYDGVFGAMLRDGVPTRTVCGIRARGRAGGGGAGVL